MKRLLNILLFLIPLFSWSQIFEGVLLYECQTNIHIKQEIRISPGDVDSKDKNAKEITLNDSSLLKKMREKDQIIDSIKIVFGKDKFRKTYFKKDNIEYIFDFNSAKKLTHTPKYECIDTTQIKLIDYKDKVRIIESDSVFMINNIKCSKVTVINSDYYFIDIYYAESQFKNQSDAFIYEINNNLLFQNLYFLRDKFAYKKIVKLKYTTSLLSVDYVYLLKSTVERQIKDDDFAFPEYEYCFWDTLEDPKLRRKHRKRMKQEQKKTKS